MSFYKEAHPFADIAPYYPLQSLHRIRMLLDILDPDPLVRGTDPDPSIKQK
jgi:hypothetical protein